MTSASAATLTQAPYWYLTRSTGIVSFVLMTIALAFGVAATQRALASPAWPRFATQTLHRNVSLLGLFFLCVHIGTTVVDNYVDVGWWSVVAPGTSNYKPVWVGVGTIAFDLLLLLTFTGLLRLRMSAKLWRQVHSTAYAVWPLSLLHFLTTGTDAAHGGFGIYIGLGCTAVVLIAVGVRRRTQDSPPTPVKSIR